MTDEVPEWFDEEAKARLQNVMEPDEQTVQDASLDSDSPATSDAVPWYVDGNTVTFPVAHGFDPTTADIKCVVEGPNGDRLPVDEDDVTVTENRVEVTGLYGYAGILDCSTSEFAVHAEPEGPDD